VNREINRQMLNKSASTKCIYSALPRSNSSLAESLQKSNQQ